MATAQKVKTDDDFQMEVEESVPKTTRGRAFDPQTLKIKDELEKQLQDRRARSFKNVEKDDRENWARKVRAAGKSLGISTATIFDPQAKKLYWGPEDVINELRKAQKVA